MESTQTFGEKKEWLNGAWIRPATVEDLSVLICIGVFSRILPAFKKQYKHSFYQILLKDR